MREHKKFVVFLDVDGVLNSRTTVQRTPRGYTGIDDARVRILADAIEKCGGADIVLSSDWKEMNSADEDYIYLIKKLEKYDLSIAGETQDSNRKRGVGILTYLEAHPEIEEYVILDDCLFDFHDYRKLWERLLLTEGLEKAQFASQTPAVETILFLDALKIVSMNGGKRK